MGCAQSYADSDLARGILGRPEQGDAREPLRPAEERGAEVRTGADWRMFPAEKKMDVVPSRLRGEYCSRVFQGSRLGGGTAVAG